MRFSQIFCSAIWNIFTDFTSGYCIFKFLFILCPSSQWTLKLLWLHIQRMYNLVNITMQRQWCTAVDSLMQGKRIFGGSQCSILIRRQIARFNIQVKRITKTNRNNIISIFRSPLNQDKDQHMYYSNMTIINCSILDMMNMAKPMRADALLQEARDRYMNINIRINC